MNQLIKITVFICLIVSALFAWVGIAFIGFFLSFTNLATVAAFTPFIGLAVIICMMKCAMYVLLKSNPIAYFEEKVSRLEALFAKKL